MIDQCQPDYNWAISRFPKVYHNADGASRRTYQGLCSVRHARTKRPTHFHPLQHQPILRTRKEACRGNHSFYIVSKLLCADTGKTLMILTCNHRLTSVPLPPSTSHAGRLNPFPKLKKVRPMSRVSSPPKLTR